MYLALALAALCVTSACKQRREPPPATEREATRAIDAPAPSCEPSKPTCVGDDVTQCNADGTPGTKLASCKGRCRNGACVDTCALQDVELIYVVDNKANLFRFDPRKLPGEPFHRVATLSCNPSSSLNSMAVDRAGIAWLGYHDGKLHRASIIDGHCSTGGAAPSGAPSAFGMGFVSDGPKATTEKLFVAGSQGQAKTLATLDTSTTPATWNRVAAIPSATEHPELTGTGDGRLFGYFPSPGRGFVQELDRTTAKPIGTRWTLDGGTDRVTAYAFAHWGGVFYVFSTAGDNSAVHAIHMKTGKQELIRQDLPRVIVGAGVSTCAPLLESTE
jgi:hypothetical protein